MNRGDICENLDAAISEIKYSIKTKKSKSEIEHEHYLRNAIRFIEDTKELMKDVEITNKVYAVTHHMDSEMHGLDSIFKNKEDAEKYAKMMIEKYADFDCHYSVREEIVYSSHDEREVAEAWELEQLFI